MKCRILVVEDDASFGLMIQSWLKKNGYEAVLASSYEQAKIEISNGAFNLILTDLRLPDGDGILLMTWVREKLKSNYKDNDFSLRSDYLARELNGLVVNEGDVSYIKQVTPSSLKAHLKQLLKKGNLHVGYLTTE